MSVNLKKGEALSTLSLTPLIDVVFLLLIFFLVATKFAEEERELNVLLPDASEAQPRTSKPRETIVNIDETGTLFRLRTTTHAGGIGEGLEDRPRQ